MNQEVIRNLRGSTLKVSLILIGLSLPFFSVFAQDGSQSGIIESSSNTPPGDISVPATSSTSGTSEPSRPLQSDSLSSTTSEPRITSPRPIPTSPSPSEFSSSTSPVIPNVAQDDDSEDPGSDFTFLVIVVTVFVALFGYSVAKFHNRKKIEDNNDGAVATVAAEGV